MADQRFDKFTDRARRVIDLSQEEAVNMNHNYIGTEHLLLGLVAEGEGVAARVLENLNVDLEKIRVATLFIIGRGDRPAIGLVGLTPRAKRVIELSIDEARRLGHQYIGTEHLLLGLVREGEGIAAGVLESVGCRLDVVRREVEHVLSATASFAATPRSAPEPTPAVQIRPVAPDCTHEHVMLDITLRTVSCVDCNQQNLDPFTILLRQWHTS